MSKLLSNPITQSDIEEYLDNYADFSFELRVLRKLAAMEFRCQHSGTYDDPITGKSREFDIRALIQHGLVRTHLSVECKNIRENFPLVVHCMERKAHESYNELIFAFGPEEESDEYDPMALSPIFLQHSRSKRVSKLSLYRKGEYVAKSADQVGRREHDKAITTTDGGIYEKISQAINASEALIEEAYYLGSQTTHLTFICPILVVPDSMLWQAKYSDGGERLGIPEQVDRVSYYIGKEWTVDDGINPMTYTISHLEIVTFTELTSFVQEYLVERISQWHAAFSRGEELS